MISSSFFDDDDQSAKSHGFWQNPHKFNKIRESKFESNPDKYFRSVLYKRAKKTNDFKTLQFTMFGNRLSYVKVKKHFLSLVFHYEFALERN